MESINLPVVTPFVIVTFRRRRHLFATARSISLKRGNLTLTFDGTTIRKQESFYTAHATTPAQDTYFLDGHQGTGKHHNAEWIMDKLLKVCLYVI